jgi:hypothetical protein
MPNRKKVKRNISCLRNQPKETALDDTANLQDKAPPSKVAAEDGGEMFYQLLNIEVLMMMIKTNGRLT